MELECNDDAKGMVCSTWTPLASFTTVPLIMGAGVGEPGATRPGSCDNEPKLMRTTLFRALLVLPPSSLLTVLIEKPLWIGGG